MTYVLGKYATRTQSVLHQSQLILKKKKKRLVEIIPLGLPIFELHLQVLTIFPMQKTESELIHAFPLTTSKRCTFNHVHIQNLALLVQKQTSG